MLRHSGDMSFGNFKKIIDQLEQSIIYLALYNLGEPLVNADIFKMAEYLKKRSIFVRLSTNGVFDKKYIEQIVDVGIDELVISLDCASPQTYKKYKSTDYFETVIENTKLIIKERGKRLKPFVNLQLLLMKDTERETAEFKKLVRILKVDRGIIKPIWVGFLGKSIRKEFMPGNNKYIRPGYKGDAKEGICYRPWFTAVILWDGSIVPCCSDMQGEYAFGNVFCEDLKSVWNNEKYILFRRNILNGIHQIPLCKECSILDVFSNLMIYG